MIFLFLSMSEVSLAKLSWEMMGAQVLMGIHSLSIGQEEIESKKSYAINPIPMVNNMEEVKLLNESYK